MDNYYNKYLKYKDKYLKLKNMPNMIGGSETSHIECTSGNNNTIFLTLLLQLLIEYEFMFDFKQDQKNQSISSIPQDISSSSVQKPMMHTQENKSIFAQDTKDNKADVEDGTDDEMEENKNNNFLSIFKFLYYSDKLTYTLLNSKEQINDAIDTISKYCSVGIKNICDAYREELYCNKYKIQSKCYDKINEMIPSFYDSRNYSIMTLFHTLLGTYDNAEYPPILVYMKDNETIIGHIFILFTKRARQDCLEAISIQSSLKTIINSWCKEEKPFVLSKEEESSTPVKKAKTSVLSKKNNKPRISISNELFTYVLDRIILLFPGTTYIYAYAWKAMSDILVEKFQFKTLTFDKSNGFHRFNDFRRGDNVTVSKEQNFTQSSDDKIYSPFMQYANPSGDEYILTIKKIER